MGRARSVFGADRPSCPTAVVDHERLPERFGEPIRRHAREYIADPAGPIGHDNLDRPLRPVLRPRRADGQRYEDKTDKRGNSLIYLASPHRLDQ